MLKKLKDTRKEPITLFHLGKLFQLSKSFYSVAREKHDDNKTQTSTPRRDNSALKEVLNKVLSEPVLKTVPEPATAFGGVPQEAAISLDSLKEKIKEERVKFLCQRKIVLQRGGDE